MGESKGKAGGYAFGQAQPGKIFLGIGLLLLGINHLSVVLGNGLMPEALAMGSWCGLVGGWVLCARRFFDSASDWARRSARREIGLGLLSLVVATGLAEAIAWFAYGQHQWS
jgi:hypothetical protein